MKDIVCLSGSMRFFPEMLSLAALLTKQGKIVLAPFATKDGNTDADAALDALHQRKIAMSEMVYVVAVDGYVGESTRREIAYAEACGIPLVYWQPEARESTPHP